MQILRRIPYYGTLALLVYMPFHIFLAQSLSLLTGGLDIWKVAKDFITIGLLLLTIGLVLTDEKLRKNQKYLIFLGLTALYGLIHAGVYLLNKNTSFSVAMLASAYNNRLFWYFLIAFGAGLLTAKKNMSKTVMKLVIAVSTLVCLLGLLQWVLPKDVLTHFGYSIARGVKPNFFINEDPNFPRVMSTIRDPNSLGAFLIVPILLLGGLFTSVRKDRRRLIAGLLMLHLLVLFLTFSRAAFGGAVIASVALLYVRNKQKAAELLRRYWMVPLVLLVIGGVGLYSQRHNHTVRSVVFRIDDKNKASSLDSDQLHYFFVERGISGIVHKPLGHGPGTAGIVSIQNPNGSFLTEDYYLQIGDEVGVAGLVVFLAVWAFVMRLLYKRKDTLSQVLFAASVGYVLMAFVMHFWSNEAIAAQWWLLAGLTLGFSTATKKAIIQPRTRTKRGV